MPSTTTTPVATRVRNEAVEFIDDLLDPDAGDETLRTRSAFLRRLIEEALAHYGYVTREADW